MTKKKLPNLENSGVLDVAVVVAVAAVVVVVPSAPRAVSTSSLLPFSLLLALDADAIKRSKDGLSGSGKSNALKRDRPIIILRKTSHNRPLGLPNVTQYRSFKA